jgi:hypothetical protein
MVKSANKPDYAALITRRTPLLFQALPTFEPFKFNWSLSLTFAFGT